MNLNPLELSLWACLLVLQTAAFTWVSRARNSNSIGYHAIASVFSNGIFFCTNTILIGLVTVQGRSMQSFAALAFLYVFSTVTGAVLMHWAAMRFLEKGKRKVGA